MRRAYISCPIIVPQSRLDQVAADLLSRGFEVTYWKRGTPYGSREKDAIKECSHFIVMLPDNKFVTTGTEMYKNARGVIKECDYYDEESYCDRNTSHLAYFSAQGLGYYDFRRDNDDGVIGNQGSSVSFFEYNPVMGTPKYRFKTEQEFIDEYRQKCIAKGWDDMDEDDWRDDLENSWDNAADIFFGEIYPYSQFEKGAEFVGDDDCYFTPSKDMLVELKYGDYSSSPRTGTHSLTNKDRRLLLIS